MSLEDKNTEEEFDNKMENQEEGSVQDTPATEQVLENFEEKYQTEKDRYLRLFAEFENYKKRTSKERVELFKTANRDVLSALLPIVDDFDRGIAEISKTEEGSNLLQGMQLIYDKLTKTLDQKGLVAMEVNQGDVFDADRHEAVTQIPAPSPDLKGKIIDVIEKGYELGEKIIRYPKVVIGQ
jgi:molecular chaperone GrpE